MLIVTFWFWAKLELCTALVCVYVVSSLFSTAVSRPPQLRDKKEIQLISNRRYLRKRAKQIGMYVSVLRSFFRVWCLLGSHPKADGVDDAIYLRYPLWRIAYKRQITPVRMNTFLRVQPYLQLWETNSATIAVLRDTPFVFTQRLKERFNLFLS